MTVSEHYAIGAQFDVLTPQETEYPAHISVPERGLTPDLSGPAKLSDGAKDAKNQAAKFQCMLCPKRFIRAYNLRSHLRTHTDERPFVCSICGKAFARQHDRRRHEGLHSGEKKFVCRGDLKDGQKWGCGRRFARADALGHHFRSEAGRICIQSLLEEESQARNAFANDASQLQTPPQPEGTSFELPAAVCAQYPALTNLYGDSLPSSKVNHDEDSNSFDARIDAFGFTDNDAQDDFYTSM